MKNDDLIKLFKKKYSSNYLFHHYEKIPIGNENIIGIYQQLFQYIIISKNNDIDSTLFERILDGFFYEIYFPEEINTANSNIIKYIDNLPKLDDTDLEKNLITIKKVYKQLSDPTHFVSASLLNLLTIDVINNIENRSF